MERRKISNVFRNVGAQSTKHSVGRMGSKYLLTSTRSKLNARCKALITIKAFTPCGLLFYKIVMKSFVAFHYVL